MGLKKKQKRTDIQALRAIAVLAVVIYHLWPDKLVGGFMGVDMFFVISGYLMTLTLLRHIDPVLIAKNKADATWQFLISFYARRIKRLIPAASVTLLGTLGLTYLTGSYVAIVETAEEIFSSALFYQNWQLVANSVDYLAATDPPTAVQHFWSLSLEEQFYLAWPLLMVAMLFFAFHLAIVYKKARISGAILPTVLLVIMFFIYGYNLTQSNPTAAYFNTFARVWELLLGAVVVFLPKLKNYDLKLLLPWLGLTLCSYALYRWNGDNFPGWHALVPAIGTVLIVYGGTGTPDSKFSFTNLFKAKPIQWIGDTSYSLYLWHWPLIILMPVILGIRIDTPSGNLLKFGLLVASFVMAWLSYTLVEIPTQKIELKKRYVYLAFVVIVGSVAGAAYLTKQVVIARTESELATLHEKVKSTSNDLCIGAKWQVNSSDCDNGFGKINTSYAQFTNSDHYRKVDDNRSCTVYDYRSKDHDDPSYYCTVGDPSSKYQIVVYGDSHTSHWTNAFDEIGKRNNVRFITMDSHTCGSEEIQKPICKDRLDFLKTSKILDRSQFVILSHLHRSTSTKNRELGNIDLTVNTIRSITKTPVFLLEDTPPSSKLIGEDCVIYNSLCRRRKPVVTNSIKRVSDNAVREKILKRKQIIRTYDMFCDSKYCYSMIGNVNVYFNVGRSKGKITNSHMTGSFSRSLALTLERKMQASNLLP